MAGPLRGAGTLKNMRKNIHKLLFVDFISDERIRGETNFLKVDSKDFTLFPTSQGFFLQNFVPKVKRNWQFILIIGSREDQDHKVFYITRNPPSEYHLILVLGMVSKWYYPSF